MKIEFAVTGLKASQRRRREKVPIRHENAPVLQSIALAYQIEEAVSDGRARDYAEVARQIGMTRARICQIMRLLRLPSAIIEKLLLSNAIGCSRLTERQLRPIVAILDPENQSKEFERLFLEVRS